MTDRLLTPADAAERCQLSTKAILRAIRAGRLRASRLGERGALRIRESDVDAWIEESVVVPEAKAEIRPAALHPALPYESPTVGRLVVTPRGARSGRARPI